MQISQKLPQFEDKKALLVVTGKQEASFYLANDSRLKKVGEFHIPKITYSDKEGHMQKHKFGKLIGSGFAREPKKQVLRNKFLNQLEDSLKQLSKRNTDIDEVYLYCPGYIMMSAKNTVPSSLKDKVVSTYRGEYQTQHPFKLLEMIQGSKNSGGVTIMKEAARKILDKAKKARKVIGK